MQTRTYKNGTTVHVVRWRANGARHFRQFVVAAREQELGRERTPGLGAPRVQCQAQLGRNRDGQSLREAPQLRGPKGDPPSGPNADAPLEPLPGRARGAGPEEGAPGGPWRDTDWRNCPKG